MQASASLSCAEVVVCSSWARLTPSPGFAVGKLGATAILGGFVANRTVRTMIQDHSLSRNDSYGSSRCRQSINIQTISQFAPQLARRQAGSVMMMAGLPSASELVILDP